MSERGRRTFSQTLCLTLIEHLSPAPSGRRAERPPFAKGASRSHEWNLLGSLYVLVPWGSSFDVNSFQASDVTIETYSPEPDDPGESVSTFPCTPTFPSRGHQRQTGTPSSFPALMRKPFRSPFQDSVHRGSFRRNFFFFFWSSFGWLSRAPVRDRWVGTLPRRCHRPAPRELGRQVPGWLLTTVQ